MDERYVEYTTHATETRGRKMDNIEAIMNQYAEEGWRLSDTLQRDGTTVGLVFERPIEPTE